MRYFFNAPTTWAMETTRYLFLATTALGGAYVLLHRGHVNVSILYDKLDRKKQAIVDIVTFFFFFAFIATLFWNTLDATLEAIKDRQHSASFWGPPIYPVYIVMTVGIVLMGLQGVAMLIRNVMLLVGDPDQRGRGLPE
jgi:TRAP-type mannitol/chloroaromatic compound transport system permease small subunit